MSTEFDFCKYVDIFYGNGQVTDFPSDGPASKWFYIKAQCGNTTPHAVLPFGKISVGAYSGGYPTGYGTHYPNTCGGIKKLWKNNRLKGFSHLHQSGTGAIDYYYNYAVVTPFYGDIENIEIFHDAENESGKPGEYSVDFNNVNCRLTTDENIAYHKYHFLKENGRVAVDFSNDGLCKKFGEMYYSYPEDCRMIIKNSSTVCFSGIFSGIKLYFCINAVAKNLKTSLFTDNGLIGENDYSVNDTKNKFGAVFDFDGNDILLRVSYSVKSFSHAEEVLDLPSADFETVSKNAYEKWNKYLSKIIIDTDNETLKTKFYSCLYHSLIKPAVIKDDYVVDYATFWDQYKTLYPLVFMIYPEGKNIADGIVRISRLYNKIPCSYGLTNMFPCEKQAKMLGIIALCDAYYMGMLKKDVIDECIIRELEREDIKSFIDTGYFERYTHIIDVTDACNYVSSITDNAELKNELKKISAMWKNAYGADGYMSDNSQYYEGDKYTYSFRLQSNIEERIALAGGKENYAKMLDKFFGFNGKRIKPVTTDIKPNVVISLTHYHVFEGFNNECDMETPFSYIFADKYSRLCEIINAGVNDSYGTGTGGLPGNNDSGGLSSLFVWLVLGIFPWSGSGKMLAGCPQIKSASITLNNGKMLNITVEKQCSDKTEIYFNGKKIDNYIIETEDLLCGGNLIFK